MRTTKFYIASILFIACAIVLGVGCKTIKNSDSKKETKVKLELPEVKLPPKLKITSVKINEFLCKDPITAQAVKNVFTEVLSRNRRLSLVNSLDDAELVIEGTITHSTGGSAGAKVGGGADWIAGKAQSVSGEFVTGITAVINRGGSTLTSVSWGQTLDKGSKLLPPEYVAREAARALNKRLDESYLRAKYGNVTWCGLDYSKTMLVGYRSVFEPVGAFQKLTIQWNDLFTDELLPPLRSVSKAVSSDTSATKNRNKSQTDVTVVDFSNSPELSVLATHISKDQIAEIVRSYSLESKSGTGWVVVCDRLVKNQEMGAFYVVQFDISTRNIIYCERFIEKAGGSAPQKYWFKPVRSVFNKLIKNERGD